MYFHVFLLTIIKNKRLIQKDGLLVKNLMASDVYGQEVKCIQEMVIRFTFQAFLPIIGRTRPLMDNFLSEEEALILVFQLFRRISR